MTRFQLKEKLSAQLMKKIAYQIKVSLTIAALYTFNSIMAYEIDHLEPPF